MTKKSIFAIITVLLLALTLLSACESQATEYNKAPSQISGDDLDFNVHENLREEMLETNRDSLVIYTLKTRT